MIVIPFGLLGTSQFFTFSTSSGFGDIPSADSTCLRKTTLCWKKWHFLGLIYKLNSSSHLNTNSIWSSISSMLVANTEISSRYNKGVTNCWYPTHISMRWQKLDPELDNPNGIWVNLYKPDDPALNSFLDVCLLNRLLSKDINPWQLWTAWSASSKCSKGKTSLIKMEFNFQ